MIPSVLVTLPGELNLYEATILPNHMRSFIGRGQSGAETFPLFGVVRQAYLAYRDTRLRPPSLAA
jgi:hypothetical protein